MDGGAQICGITRQLGHIHKSGLQAEAAETIAIISHQLSILEIEANGGPTLGIPGDRVASVGIGNRCRRGSRLGENNGSQAGKLLCFRYTGTVGGTGAVTSYWGDRVEVIGVRLLKVCPNVCIGRSIAANGTIDIEIHIRKAGGSSKECVNCCT